jgi:hypothetical protein
MTGVFRPVKTCPEMMREFFEEGKEPVFEYENRGDKLPAVDKTLISLAIRILQKGRVPALCLDDPTEFVSPEQFVAAVKSYIEFELGIGVESVVISITDHLDSLVAVSRKKRLLSVRVSNRPIPKRIVPSLLAHEIGTHFLRMYNDDFKHRYSWSSRKTEEGLAVLGAMFCENNPSLWSPALRYFACVLASDLGFRDLFNSLSPFIENKEARFRYCCRAKRGVQDTGQAGAFGSSQVYLIGIHELVEKRREIDWFGLFSGIVDLNHRSSSRSRILPPFLRTETQLDQFRSFLDQVANEFTT